MTKIYDQHTAAFKNVQAFVILNEWNERVATIAFKFPKDGAGRLYAYVHYLGLEMSRGYANGYGYDKKSAAVEHAVSITTKKMMKDAPIFKALTNIGGATWESALRDAGFSVLQAV